MRLTVGILTHNSEHVASRCLETVVAQTGVGTLNHDWQVISLDNASNNRIELIRLEKRFPQVRFLRQERNIGFGRGHNTIMRMFPADFHAVLNCDVLLTPDFLEQLLRSLDEQPQYGSAIGKLLQWNFGRTEERSTTIDSVGIGVTKSHAFFDIGQGTPLRLSGSAGKAENKETFNEPEERFGGSGAAVLYRRSALEEVAYEAPEGPEFFDETMFLYKEDIDLAYRLLSSGHPCLYVPHAVAWHARTMGTGQKRQRRPSLQRAWSAAHELLILRKHRCYCPLDIRMRTALRQCGKWLYLVTLEPRVFFSARKLLRSLRVEAEKRCQATKHTAPFASVAHLFR